MKSGNARKYVSLALVFSMFGFAIANAASSWPASSSGTNIGSGIAALYPTFEASGIAWHPGLSKMFVVGDEGQIVKMDSDGSNVTMWTLSGKDLEGVAIDPNSNEYIYLGNEDGYIYKFSLTSGSVVQTWDIRTYIPEVSGKYGMEGLTYVDGYLYGGSQYDGKITVFDISGASVQVVQTLDYSLITLQDLYYASETEVLYVLGGGKVREVKNGLVSPEYYTVGSGEEGITLLPGCPASTTTIYIAEDTNGSSVNVKTYGGYPISCPSVTPTTTTSDWPAGVTTTDLSAGIAAIYPSFEASGLIWNDASGVFVLVGDNGQVAITDATGGNASVTSVGGDLEGVAVGSDGASYVYLGDENGYVYKYSLSSKAIVQTWDVRSFVTISSGKGMEGLTYVDGYFYAGSQSDGKISVLDLSGTSAALVQTLDYSFGTLSDLFYSDEEDALYVIVSGYLKRINSGAVTSSYALPGSIQEGLTFMPGCPASTNNIYVTEDHGDTGGVYFKSYTSYPITCATVAAPVDPDVDGDGVAASLDCNDADATVSAYTTYYKDNDKDSYGYEAASLCYASAPSGYVTNALDLDDTKGIEISGDKKDNDGDGKVDEVNTVSENGYHPYYSRLDPSVAYGTNIKGYGGYGYGDFRVKYGDNSTYRYSAFTINTKTVSTVTPVNGTGYFTITSGSYSAVVNAYTGL